MLPLFPGRYDYGLGDPTNVAYDDRLRDPTFNPGSVWSLKPGAVWVWQGGDVDSGNVGFWSADSTPAGGVNPDGGFFSSVVSAIATVVVATSGLQIAGASGANVAVNVVQGNSLTQNAGLAGAVDLAGLAAGAGIAGTGIVDAAAGGGSVDLGALVAAPETSVAPDLSTLYGSSLETAGTISPAAGGGLTFNEITGAAKAAIGAAGTASGVFRLVNPPKPPKPIAPPTTPAPSSPAKATPACNVCGIGRVLLGLGPLVLGVFSL